ncbi:hypothetical protein LSH36_499g01040 [Paralvinella palmiformis]|uniref:UBZ4-type domain-containing protein n=1 Tax=Paralvinella palmiformis TaxID=53620 RepID=A0AAD9J8T8_9ANNE|nr:hypothetical protein LSH36_499g01040 [Paralvinella palmiformis]
MTPPVTLKSFFKALPKAEPVLANSPLVDDQPTTGRSSSGTIASGGSRSTESDAFQSEDAKTEKVDGARNASHRIGGVSGASLSVRGKGIKRPAVHPGQPAGNKKVCRPKQTSITAFAQRKQDGGRQVASSTGDRQSDRQIMSCPVCGKVFPATALNSDVNKHVDQCLTE